jgi:hypothetical protein
VQGVNPNTPAKICSSTSSTGTESTCCSKWGTYATASIRTFVVRWGPVQRSWAEAALMWLTQQAEIEEETSRMAAAMQASLQEAEHRKAAEKPLMEQSDEELRQRFESSSLLPKVLLPGGLPLFPGAPWSAIGFVIYALYMRYICITYALYMCYICAQGQCQDVGKCRCLLAAR